MRGMPRPDPADVAHSRENRLGWVYVLAHPEMPGLAKLGATRKHPIQRATELSAGTGVPGQFTVAYYRSFSDAFEAEGLLHDRLADVRVDAAREFFRVSVEEAAGLIRGLAEELESDGREGGEMIDAGVVLPVGPNVEDLYPMAVLFSTFPDDGEGRELTLEERAKCRALSR